MDWHTIGLYVLLGLCTGWALLGSMIFAALFGCEEPPPRGSGRAWVWLGLWFVHASALFVLGMVFPGVSRGATPCPINNQQKAA